MIENWENMSDDLGEQEHKAAADAKTKIRKSWEWTIVLYLTLFMTLMSCSSSCSCILYCLC